MALSPLTGAGRDHRGLMASGEAGKERPCTRMGGQSGKTAMPLQGRERPARTANQSGRVRRGGLCREGMGVCCAREIDGRYPPTGLDPALATALWGSALRFGSEDVRSLVVAGRHGLLSITS